MTKRIRVLIVDDSALIRQILEDGLNEDPGIEVVGVASNAFQARDKIVEMKPDVMTLDVEMPKMDGLEFLRKLMPQYPIPVVMVSALTERGKKIAMQALEVGAVDFVTKPKTDLKRGFSEMMMELRTKVKIASVANVSHWKNMRPRVAEVQKKSHALAESTDKVIVIGASTGGTEAIHEVISRLPAATPGVVVVQHMPPGFTRLFAERLNATCSMEVKEAENGDRILQGRVLIAPGGLHMTVIRFGGIYTAECKPGPLVNGHCPSVEVLMQSAAKYIGSNAVGVMLTGMGGDGGTGLKAMREAGAKTLAQDEATSVVFGMPRVAWECGGAERLVPLPDIAQAVLQLVSLNGGR